jgi:hypothetical protein
VLCSEILVKTLENGAKRRLKDRQMTFKNQLRFCEQFEYKNSTD